MATPTYGHVHSGLASAHFDVADAVWASTRDGQTWAIYLDDSLSRWEVFIDAPAGRVFVAEPTWRDLDGPAQVQFEDDFVGAYRGTDTRELRVLRDEVYQAGARRRAVLEGTAHRAAGDRVAELARRAQEAVVAAAGVSAAPSALQLQVFAARHALLVEELAGVERDLARARSAVELAGSALQRVLL